MGDTSLQDHHLAALAATTEATTAAARRLFAELTPELQARKSAPDVWCVTECFAHLVVAADLYHPGIEEVIAALRAAAAGPAAENRAPRPYRARFLHRRFLDTAGVKSPRKVKTFKVFEPWVTSLDPAAVEGEFRTRQNELLELLRRADGLDLNRGRIVSPVTRLLRFTLGEALELMVVHAQRHLRQAEDLRPFLLDRLAKNHDEEDSHEARRPV